MKVHDDAGGAITLDAGSYNVDVLSEPARLVLKGAVPTVAVRALNAFEIAFTAGYGGAADDVPGPIKQALKLLVAHWFERRVEITGLEELRRRFEAARARERFRQALREEAETIAAEARREAQGDLAQTIEVEDMSQGETIAFAIGTSDPAGRAAEFGTLKRPAALGFGRFSRRIYQELRTSFETSR